MKQPSPNATWNSGGSAFPCTSPCSKPNRVASNGAPSPASACWCVWKATGRSGARRSVRTARRTDVWPTSETAGFPPAMVDFWSPPAELWSAVTWHGFRQATWRRRSRVACPCSVLLDLVRFVGRVSQSRKATTRRTENEPFSFSSSHWPAICKLPARNRCSSMARSKMAGCPPVGSRGRAAG